MFPPSHQASRSGTQQRGSIARATLITSAPLLPPPSILSSSNAPTHPHSSAILSVHHNRAMQQQQQQNTTDAVLEPKLKKKKNTCTSDWQLYAQHSFLPSNRSPSLTRVLFPKQGPNIPISTAACQVYCPLLPKEEIDKVVLGPFSRNWILSNDAFYTVTDWFYFKGWDNIR